MNRREFLSLTVAALALPVTGNAAGGILNYQPGLVGQLLAVQRTVLVDYYASWCGTCRVQERVVARLRDQNPLYDANIMFVRVDWDVYARAAISKKYNIPRRSTLLLLREDQELGRIVAGTRRRDIQALLDAGVPSA